jgi:hypothetical protein
MAEAHEYIAKMNTFVDGVLVRAGGRFTSDRKPAKCWQPVHPDPVDDEQEGDEGKKSVRELLAEISGMTDMGKLAELKNDERKTVANAAEKRIAQVAGPAPGGETGGE